MYILRYHSYRYTKKSLLLIFDCFIFRNGQHQNSISYSRDLFCYFIIAVEAEMLTQHFINRKGIREYGLTTCNAVVMRRHFWSVLIHRGVLTIVDIRRMHGLSAVSFSNTYLYHMPYLYCIYLISIHIYIKYIRNATTFF